MTAATAVLALAGVLVATSSVSAVAADRGGMDEARVVKVVDGDTLDVTGRSGTQRVRLLNVDAPETVDPNRPVQCQGAQASAFLTELLPTGTVVTLQYDKDREDRYGRTLAAVSVGTTLVNVRLAEEGLALPVTVGHNDRFRPDVERGWKRAVKQKKGLLDPQRECTASAQVEALAETFASLSSAAQWSELDQLAETVAGTDAVKAQAQTLFALLVAGVGIEVAALPGNERAVYARSVYGIYAYAGVLRRAAVAREKQLRTLVELKKKADTDASEKAEAAAKKRTEEMRKAEAKSKAKAAAKKATSRKAAAGRAAEQKADADRRTAAEKAKKPPSTTKKPPSTTRKPPSTTRKPPSTTRKPPSTTKKKHTPGGGSAGYTGCRKYAPGGKTWTPIPCP